MANSGYLTTNSLIATIKRKALIPTSNKTFQTEDYLAFINEEILIGVVPSVLSTNEEFFVWSEETTITANKSNYPIPYRALGGKLRDVFYKDTQGNLVEMTRISPDDKSMYQNSTYNYNFPFFYIQGNDVVLTPGVGDNPVGSLVFTYFLRPNNLVAEDEVALISSIAIDTNAGTTTYTVNRVPTTFSTSVKLDLMQTKPGHRMYAFDIQASAINSNNKMITFNTDDVDSSVEVGDCIALASECIIPQIPSDMHYFLAERVAARCLESLGDQAGLQAANQKIAEMEVKTNTLIERRVDGAPLKIVNHKGLLSSSLVRRRGRW